MNKNTHILHKILLCLVLISSFFAFTACPQFDRDIDPDYKLFKDKPEKNKNENENRQENKQEKKQEKNNNSQQNDKGLKSFVLDIACFASNEVLYMCGSKAGISDSTMLYSIAKNSDSINEEIKFSSGIKKIKELEEGILFVSTQNEIYRYDIETKQLKETQFASFEQGIRDVIHFNSGYAVITDAPNLSSYWYLLSDNGDKVEVKFPVVESKMSTVAVGTDYFQLPGEDVIVYLSDVKSSGVNASTNIYGVRFVLTDASAPKAYVKDSRYYNNEYNMKAPLALLSDTKIITANGMVFEINASSVKEDNTDFSSSWCIFEKDYCLDYSMFYSDGEKFYFLKNDASGNCIVEERNCNSQPDYTGSKIKYEGEKGSDFFNIDGKVYMITNKLSDYSINFHVPEADIRNAKASR